MKLLVIAVALVIVFAIVRLITKKKDQNTEPAAIEPLVKFLKEDEPVVEQKVEDVVAEKAFEAPKKVLVVKSKSAEKKQKPQQKIVEAKAPAKTKKSAQAPAQKAKTQAKPTTKKSAQVKK
jgi:hypothetical protein